MQRRGVADVPQPIVDEAVTLAVHRRRDAAAAVVAADDHVLDLKSLDRELQHREAIHVGVADEIRDIAMDKDLARREIDYDVR